jgi:cytochrome b pre-mRNA-processing protein 3
MILHLFRRSPRDNTITLLYGMIVAQARAEPFYRDFGVPDTVTGRFEMVLIHLILLLDQLAEQPDPRRNVGQDLFDHFCRDMDDSFREMGVGDLAVPRQMRKVGEAFYGRSATYRAALARDDDAELTEALRRTVFADGQDAHGAGALAAYMKAARSALALQHAQGGNLDAPVFPDPGQFAPRDVTQAAAR